MLELKLPLDVGARQAMFPFRRKRLQVGIFAPMVLVTQDHVDIQSTSPRQ